MGDRSRSLPNSQTATRCCKARSVARSTSSTNSSYRHLMSQPSPLELLPLRQHPCAQLKATTARTAPPRPTIVAATTTMMTARRSAAHLHRHRLPHHRPPLHHVVHAHLDDLVDDRVARPCPPVFTVHLRPLTLVARRRPPRPPHARLHLPHRLSLQPRLPPRLLRLPRSCGSSTVCSGSSSNPSGGHKSSGCPRCTATPNSSEPSQTARATPASFANASATLPVPPCGTLSHPLPLRHDVRSTHPLYQSTALACLLAVELMDVGLVCVRVPVPSLIELSRVACSAPSRETPTTPTSGGSNALMKSRRANGCISLSHALATLLGILYILLSCSHEFVVLVLCLGVSVCTVTRRK